MKTSRDYTEAAQILRDLKERLDREEEEPGTADSIQIFRTEKETSLGRDTTNVSTSTAGSGTFDEDNFDFTDFQQ